MRDDFVAAYFHVITSQRHDSANHLRTCPACKSDNKFCAVAIDMERQYVALATKALRMLSFAKILKGDRNQIADAVRKIKINIAQSRAIIAESNGSASDEQAVSKAAKDGSIPSAPAKE